MKDITPQKAFRRRLNAIFALFTVIKLLMLVVFYRWHVPFLFIIRLFDIEDSDAAIEALASSSTLEGLLTSISIYLFVVAVPTALYLAFRKENALQNEKIYSKKPKLFECLCTLGTTMTVAYFFTLIFYIIVQLALSNFGYQFYPPVPDAPTNPWLMLLFIFQLCCCPAFSEELLIRGASLPTFKKAGSWYAVFLTALFFMMLHNSVSNLVFAFTTGICLSWAVIKFKSIWVGIFAHFFVNLNAAILQFALVSMETQADLVLTIVYCLFTAALSISFFVATALIYGFKLPKTERKNAEEVVYKKRVILLCPFFYIFVIIFVVSTWNGIISMFNI